MEHFLKFDIRFNKEEVVFFPGEKVEGIICVEVRQSIRVEELFIELCGELDMRRSTVINALFPSVRRVTENIINLRQIAIRSSEISSRHFDLNFSFTLPIDSPQSLEAWPLAEMRYFIIAVAQFPSTKKITSISVKRLFTVLEQNVPVDISSISQASRLALTSPASVCQCCNDGTIDAQLNLRKIYFVPGEDVVASILVDNQSSHRLKKVTFSISQIIRRTLSLNPNESHSSNSKVVNTLLSRTVSQTQCLGSLDIGPVAPSGLARHRRCKLHLPAVPCTARSTAYAGSRRHIDISYVVQLRISVPCFRHDLVLSTPFIVGTAPLPVPSPITDVTQNGDSATPRKSSKTYPSAFVESANGPITYRGLKIAHPSGILSGSRLAVLCVYTPQYFYFPTISCTPKPGTPSTLRSILKPRSTGSSIGSAATSSIFSDTASTTNSYISDSFLNIHFESPV